jgi:hypothetical protein
VENDFVRLARPFAAAISAKVEALVSLDLTKSQRARFHESIGDDIRKLCDIAVPVPRRCEVSVAAKRLADALGVDLRVQTWHTQSHFDKGRLIFHYEHMNPVSELRSRCLAHSQVDAILLVLDRDIRVAWITKEEDLELTRLGFRASRPDPEEAYRIAGIELLAADEAQHGQ